MTVNETLLLFGGLKGVGSGVARERRLGEKERQEAFFCWSVFLHYLFFVSVLCFVFFVTTLQLCARRFVDVKASPTSLLCRPLVAPVRITRDAVRRANKPPAKGGFGGAVRRQPGTHREPASGHPERRQQAEAVPGGCLDRRAACAVAGRA